jgi:hypothetical protein
LRVSSINRVDVLIGQNSGDDPGSRLAAARDRFVGLDRDRDAIIRVETLRTNSAATSPTVVSITSFWDDMALAPHHQI